MTLVDRLFTTTHTIEIVEIDGHRYAYRYVSYGAVITAGKVERVERADSPLDITKLPLKPNEARRYIARMLPGLQSTDYQDAI